MKKSHILSLSLSRVCICLLSLIAVSIAAQAQAQAGVGLTNPGHDWQILHGTVSIQMKAQSAAPSTQYTVSLYFGENEDQVAAGSFTTDGNGNWGPGEVATWDTTGYGSDGSGVLLAKYIKPGDPPPATEDGSYTVTIANSNPAWEPPDVNGNGIQWSGITSPTEGTFYEQSSSSFEVACSCAEATDSDHRYAPSGSPHDTYPSDTLTYGWSAGTLGSWKNGLNTGRNVTWVCPANYAGYVTITCTVHDAANLSGENGSRDDDDLQNSVHLTVLGITITGCPSDWLPEGGETQGNTVSFTGTTVPTVTTDIKFTLLGVSSEPGYCLNAGSQTDSDKDLKFTASDNPAFTVSENGLTATESNVPDAAVAVRCYDYGAYGLIEAESVGTYAGAESGTKDIPKDENSNCIADAWTGEDGTAYYDEDDDPEGDGTDGDGFSLYEEYRGFVSNAAYDRLDPTKKDIFVWDVDGLNTGHFLASDLEIHRLAADGSECDANRVVNFKSHLAHTDQKALKLLEVTERNYGQVYGDSYPPSGPREIPNNCDWCKIYTGEIRYWIMESKQNTVIGWTIAHELAHGCSVEHHEHAPNQPCTCIMHYPVYQPDPGTVPTAYCTEDPGCLYQFKLH
jgi:hypothetical protein